MQKRVKLLLSFLSIFLVFLIFHLYIRNRTSILDESFHFDQIMRFVKFDFTFSKSLFMGPGFHLFMFLPVKIFGINNISSMRLLVLLINLSLLPIFYLTARKINRDEAQLKLFQFAFSPLFFPYFLIIFTDIFSTVLIVLTFYLILLKRYNLAGIVGIYCLVIRQNNIFWITFLLLIICYQEGIWQINLKNFQNFFSKCWVFLIGFVLFLLFIAANKGFAFGSEAKSYLPLTLSMGNIYFLLFTFFIIFLPENLLLWKKVFKFAKNYLFLTAIFLLFVFFFNTYENTHVWNQTWYLLRNKIIIYSTLNTFNKMLFFLPVIFSLVILFITKLHSKVYYLIYPIAFFSLLVTWLVEPRYYLPFISFYMLTRKIENKKGAYFSVVVNLLISTYIVWGMKNNIFFP